jgi:hypothetical protein
MTLNDPEYTYWYQKHFDFDWTWKEMVCKKNLYILGELKLVAGECTNSTTINKYWRLEQDGIQ